MASRWANVLGVPHTGGPEPALALDGGEVSFVAAPEQRAEGLVEIGLAGVPGLGLGLDGDRGEVGGVRLRSVP